MSFFAKPISVWVPLDNAGNTIEVKKELNIGDQKRLEAAGLRRVQRVQADGKIGYEVETDWENFDVVRASIWLTDWSGPAFNTDNGTKVPLSLPAIKALTQEAFALIDAALDAHVTAVDQEKKLKATPIVSSAETPLPS